MEKKKRRLKCHGHVKKWTKVDRPKNFDMAPPTKRKSESLPEDWTKQTIKDMGRRNMEEGAWRNR